MLTEGIRNDSRQLNQKAKSKKLKLLNVQCDFGKQRWQNNHLQSETSPTNRNLRVGWTPKKLSSTLLAGATETD